MQECADIGEVGGGFANNPASRALELIFMSIAINLRYSAAHVCILTMR